MAAMSSAAGTFLSSNTSCLMTARLSATVPTPTACGPVKLYGAAPVLMSRPFSVQPSTSSDR